MNSDSEAINQFLAWLLQASKPTVAEPSGDSSIAGTEPVNSGAEKPQLHHLDPLDSEELDELLADLSDSNHFSIEEIPLFNPGEISTVQDRFHTLLKRRLRAEIEQKPPLFPWETQISDYESEVPDWNSRQLVPAHIWSTQLQTLNLPVPMPEDLLARLFTRCQEFVQASLQEGVKLVRVVEEFFPGNSQALNQLAGLVLVSPLRSGSAVLSSTISRYEAATQAQQMALSLIAAREIFNTMTLTVSPDQPKVERQWQTPLGLLTLQAEAVSHPGHLRIQGQLPCSGSLQFQSEYVQASTQRTNPGCLMVEVFDLEPNQVYSLEVRLANSDDKPLLFAVHPINTLEA
jgi:hypothetical protein